MARHDDRRESRPGVRVAAAAEAGAADAGGPAGVLGRRDAGPRRDGLIGSLEPARGIEPPTYGLQNRCSAVELRRPGSARVPKGFFESLSAPSLNSEASPSRVGFRLL